MTKITYVCADCGSDDLLADAWAQWDEEKQEFVLMDADLGSYWCRQCDGETKRIKEKEIS